MIIAEPQTIDKILEGLDENTFYDEDTFCGIVENHMDQRSMGKLLSKYFCRYDKSNLITLYSTVSLQTDDPKIISSIPLFYIDTKSTSYSSKYHLYRGEYSVNNEIEKELPIIVYETTQHIFAQKRMLALLLYEDYLSGLT